MVGRQKPPEIGDEKIQEAVGVEVDRLDMCRARQRCDPDENGLLFVRPGGEHGAVPHVTQHDLEAAITVEIDETDVCDGCFKRRLGSGDHALAEEGRVIRGRPALGCRKGFGSVRFVIRDDRLPLRRQLYHPRRRTLRPPRFGQFGADRKHPGDLVAPDVPGQNVWRRKYVALNALGVRRRITRRKL